MDQCSYYQNKIPFDSWSEVDSKNRISATNWSIGVRFKGKSRKTNEKQGNKYSGQRIKNGGNNKHLHKIEHVAVSSRVGLRIYWPMEGSVLE